jgi:hypothetical protein
LHFILEFAIENTQRLLNLQTAVRNGKMHFRPQDEECVQEFMAVSLRPGKLLEPNQLSEQTLNLVRVSAMALHVSSIEYHHNETVAAEISLADGQSELFRLFAEIFVVLTGHSYDAIYSHEEIKESVLKQLRRSSESFERDFNAAMQNLGEFYNEHSSVIFRHAKELGGLKVVLGGQRTFGSSALGGIRKMGLYVDTQLIPDPIYPFFETELHLKAKYVELMLNLHRILQLKPLVDARLPVPPILVFPSFEKILEERDVKTQVGIQDLVLQVAGSACPATLLSMEELVKYTHERKDEFIHAMLAAQLFVPPGAMPGQIMSAHEAIERHLAELREFRSPENMAEMEKLPPESVILVGIMERLTPQYHLLENGEELSAQPLLTQSAHWHYFEKCAQSAAQTLRRNGLLSEDAFLTVRALQSEKLAWLENVPIPTLAVLLQNQENIGFRDELRKHTALLTAAGATDLDRVVREVTHAVESLVQKHQKTIKDIEAKYSSKNAIGIGLGGAAIVVGAAAQFMPSLGVLGVAAPVATVAGAVANYTNTKLQEHAEKKLARRSLMGVLATTARN